MWDVLGCIWMYLDVLQCKTHKSERKGFVSHTEFLTLWSESYVSAAPSLTAEPSCQLPPECICSLIRFSTKFTWKPQRNRAIKALHIHCVYLNGILLQHGFGDSCSRHLEAFSIFISWIPSCHILPLHLSEPALLTPTSAYFASKLLFDGTKRSGIVSWCQIKGAVRPNASLKQHTWTMQCLWCTKLYIFLQQHLQEFATSSQHPTPVSQQEVLGNSVENCSDNGEQHEYEKDKAWITGCNCAAWVRCFCVSFRSPDNVSKPPYGNATS